MMKLFYNLQRGVGLLVFCTILLSACVNHISEEEEDSVNNGDIPLKFIADIRESVGTRMANNNFAEGDEVGLFALAGTTTMQEERYVDNLHFIRSSNGEFESNESVYYPDDGVTLNLISYYPYQKSGVGIGESTMQVAVSTTQNIPDDYSHSDFLIASKEEVLASKEAVALTYNHQFFRLKIVLIPGEGENLEDMLSVKPTLSVSGFYTKTSYDFQKKTFSGYSEEKDIIPAGEWEIKDGRLIGNYFDTAGGDSGIPIHNVGSCRKAIYKPITIYFTIKKWKAARIGNKVCISRRCINEQSEWGNRRLGRNRNRSYRISHAS